MGNPFEQFPTTPAEPAEETEKEPERHIEPEVVEETDRSELLDNKEKQQKDTQEKSEAPITEDELVEIGVQYKETGDKGTLKKLENLLEENRIPSKHSERIKRFIEQERKKDDAETESEVLAEEGGREDREEKKKIASGVKEYTKDWAPEERDRLARELKQSKREHFSRREEVFQEIERVTVLIEKQESSFSDVARSVERLEGALEEVKSSLVNRLIDNIGFLKNLRVLERVRVVKEAQRLEGRLAMESKMLEQAQRWKSDSEQLLGELTAQLDDKSRLEKARSKLVDFYDAHSEGYDQYIEEGEVRSLENIAKDNDVYFVHAIRPDAGGLGSLLDIEEPDWRLKLNILLGIEPTISASTTSEGDTYADLWGRMGVVLKGGRVMGAHSGDAFSVAEGFKIKSGTQEDVEEFKESLDETLSYRRQQPGDERGYNEFIVRDPKVGGFFVCIDNWDEQSRSHRRTLVEDPREIMAFLKEINMPLYVLYEGQLYDTEFDPLTGAFEYRDKVGYDQVFNSPFHVEDAQKKKITNRILEEAPFVMKSTEMAYLLGRNDAADRYVASLALHSPDAVPVSGSRVFESSTMSDSYEGPGIAELEGKSYQVVDVDLPPRLERSSGYESLVQSGIIAPSEKAQHEFWLSEGKLYCVEKGSKKTYIYNWRSTWNPIIDKLSFLDVMEEKWNKAIGSDDVDAMYRVAFELYGVADQAEQIGDSETRERVTKLAGQVLSHEAYQTIVARRGADEGKFKMLEKDIR